MINTQTARWRCFPVRMPSGERYWTVLDETLTPVQEVDEFLRHVRFGRDRAESTTATYASGIALYLTWCARTGSDWREGAARLGAFMLWLRHAELDQPATVIPGPGHRPVRGARRINTVLAGVREFLRHGVANGTVAEHVLGMLYQVADTRELPVDLRGESGTLRYYAKARHRAAVPHEPVDRASDEEVLGLLRACGSARDRLIVLLMARAGLRRGELVGLRREDIHFVVDARLLGCAVAGSHLHVVRRDNTNGAWAKSRRARVVPVDFLLVQAFDQYVVERSARVRGEDSDFVLVNLRRPPVGAPMKPGAVNELLVRLSRRAGLEHTVHPHALRHAFASNIVAAGAAIDEVQRLLGHVALSSTQVYLHPSPERLRAAVDRVGAPERGGRR